VFVGLFRALFATLFVGEGGGVAQAHRLGWAGLCGALFSHFSSVMLIVLATLCALHFG
jgi:hypothetical protein